MAKDVFDNYVTIAKFMDNPETKGLKVKEAIEAMRNFANYLEKSLDK